MMDGRWIKESKDRLRIDRRRKDERKNRKEERRDDEEDREF